MWLTYYAKEIYLNFNHNSSKIRVGTKQKKVNFIFCKLQEPQMNDN